MVIRRLMALAVILIMCFGILTSCGSSADIDTAPTFSINGHDISSYIIVRSDFSGDDEVKFAIALKKFIKDVTGADLKITSDWETDSSTAPECEILIGNVNRNECKNFVASMVNTDDCAWGVMGSKLLFHAKDVKSLYVTLDKFAADYFGADSASTATLSKKIELANGDKTEFVYSEKLLLKNGGEIMNSLNKSRLWGVNAHNKGHAPYTDSNTDEIIKIAAEMGSTIYRINYNPVDDSMLTYINHVIDECHRYGMKVMLVLDNMSGTNEEIKKRMEYIAKNLDGKADYFQLFNETDIWCSKNEDGSFYNITNWTGMTQEYYNPERVAVCIEKMRTAIEAFNSTAPDAKLVVNIGSRHYPILDWYIEAGLSWDIIGYDIYDLDLWSHADFFKEMEKRYPGYEYMVTECNYPANSGEYTEKQQSLWLTKFFAQMNAIESDKLIGVMVYELMDENPIQKSDRWNGEAHFGIVKTNQDLTIGEPKEAYYELQKLLCGGEAKITTIYEKID